MAEGRFLSILGKSGSGKTTLIKCIYGLEDLQEGSITFNGHKVLGPAFHLIPGNASMSLVSQDFYVLDNHTVRENIWDKLIGYTDEYKARRCQQLLKLLDLENLKEVKARQLSSGQKQRVAIARALSRIPPLLLLDEPFNNLDKLMKDKLFHFIRREVQTKNASVIMITHIPEEALKYSDYIGIMEEGQLVQFGSTESVFYKPKNQKIAGLLGDYFIMFREDVIHPDKTLKPKTLVRPHTWQISENARKNYIPVTVQSSFFNGKCFEILTETQSGKSLLFYHSGHLPGGLKLKLIPRFY